MIATSHRQLVITAERGWLTFTYGAVTEYYLDIQNGALTLGFGEQLAPLLA